MALVLLTWCGAFVGIYLVFLPSLYSGLPATAKVFLIGSFGASAALLYAAPQSELAQPCNVVVGHVMSALIGVTAYKLVGQYLGLAAALAVATSIVSMQLTRTLHPPAAATALIAVLGPAKVHDLGYHFVVAPVFMGVAILIVVALAVNNLSADPSRHYPASWW
jgi:CBS-domain-containing membrane protein